MRLPTRRSLTAGSADFPSSADTASTVPLAAAVLKRPDLWPTALDALRRHRRARWWASAPFLPVPDGGWMAFRRETAFADARGLPTPAELVDYLEWLRTM